MARAEENHLDPLYLHFAGMKAHGTPVDGGGGCTPQCDTAAVNWDSLSWSPACLVPTSDPEQGGNIGIWHSRGAGRWLQAGAAMVYSYFLFPRHHTQALCTWLTSLLAWLAAGLLLFLM